MSAHPVAINPSPAIDALAITPSDSVTFGATRAIYVGGAGALAVTLVSGASVTFNGVPAGAILDLAVTQVRATGTTATNIVGLW